MVTGVGGTELDDQIVAPMVGADADGATITRAFARSQFGFLTFVRATHPARWKVRIRNVNGHVIRRCALKGFSAHCTAP